MNSRDDTALCALCGDDTGVDLAWAAAFPGLVCTACEARSVSASGEPPEHRVTEDRGDNPVFIDEKKCWRRYRMGGYVTMFDRFDCASLEAYLARSNPEAEPEEEDDDLGVENEDSIRTDDGSVVATIATLRSSLAGIANERELLAVLDAGLGRLRALYKKDRAAFADRDVAYLKGVAMIVEALEAFIETLDGMTTSPDAATVATAEKRLRVVRPLLEPFAVGGRLAEELRALGARAGQPLASPPVPNPPPEPPPETPSESRRCPDGHRMVVRRGPGGRYWECSRAPECAATAEID